jgi:hypothetical protein
MLGDRDRLIRTAHFTCQSRPSFRSLPEGACLAKFIESCQHVHDVLSTVGDPIRVQAFAKIPARKELHQILQSYNSFFGPGIELRPVSNVFFRPEEIHRASGVRDVVEPLPEGNRHIGNQAFRLSVKHYSITNFHANGESAIQTRTIYTDRFPWEEPADRQRFKSSLPKPFLPAIDGYSVVSGKVVEGSKRGD